jgi:hypothetical protein
VHYAAARMRLFTERGHAQSLLGGHLGGVDLTTAPLHGMHKAGRYPWLETQTTPRFEQLISGRTSPHIVFIVADDWGTMLGLHPPVKPVAGAQTCLTATASS